MRLLWRLTTPRRLRRTTLVALLLWTAVALAHQSGLFGGVGDSLPEVRVPVQAPARWLPAAADAAPWAALDADGQHHVLYRDF